MTALSVMTRLQCDARERRGSDRSQRVVALGNPSQKSNCFGDAARGAAPRVGDDGARDDVDGDDPTAERRVHMYVRRALRATSVAVRVTAVGVILTLEKVSQFCAL